MFVFLSQHIKVSVRRSLLTGPQIKCCGSVCLDAGLSLFVLGSAPSAGRERHNYTVIDSTTRAVQRHQGCFRAKYHYMARLNVFSEWIFGLLFYKRRYIFSLVVFNQVIIFPDRVTQQLLLFCVQLLSAVLSTSTLAFKCYVVMCMQQLICSVSLLCPGHRENDMYI